MAEDGKSIVGHILFTQAVIEDTGRTIQGMGLAPMAVMPARQKQGIGSSLVERGLEILREQGCPFVIVRVLSARLHEIVLFCWYLQLWTASSA